MPPRRTRQRLALALAVCSAWPGVAASADQAAITLPAAPVGDHVRYHVHACRQKWEPGFPRRGAPTCSESDVEIAMRAPGADGAAVSRWTVHDVHPGYPVESLLREPQFLVRRAIADGVPVDLVIDGQGKPVRIADLAAFRARLKQQAVALFGGNAAKAQPLVQAVQSLPDAAVLAAVSEYPKALGWFRGVPLVPGSTLDDVQAMDTIAGPRVPLNRHATVAPPSAGDATLEVVVDMSLDPAQARALVEAAFESVRKQGTPTARDEEQLRQARNAPMTIHFSATTTVDPRSAWPRRVVTVRDLELGPQGDHEERTFSQQ